MRDRILIARQALKGALRARQKANISNSDPICAFDFAERLNIEVKFIAAPSLEGMYAKKPNTIILTSQRPIGRKAYTCSHEIGHSWFDHGNCIDNMETIESEKHSSPEEQLADDFAAYLLMPPTVVRNEAKKRNIDLHSITAFEVFKLSCQLGVGYTTLIRHLQYSMKILPYMYSNKLLSIPPKDIKSEFLQEDFSGNLMFVDFNWSTVSIDLEVGDKAIVPINTVCENKYITLDEKNENGTIITAKNTGIERIESTDGKWASYIRICKKDFIGRSIYRHMEDDDE